MLYYRIGHYHVVALVEASDDQIRHEYNLVAGYEPLTL
jgi:uncharacterized protein with GYD domain